MQSKPGLLIDLWITRHGQTESNVKRLIAGHRGDHLTKLGKQQAQKLCLRLSKLKLDRAYVSDLSRTRQTADPLIKLSPALPVTYTNLLRQKGGGELQGKPLSTTAQNARKLGISVKEYRPKGGQSWNDVYERVRKFLTLLFLQHINEQSKSVLVITHGGWIMEFQNFLKKMRHMPKNAMNNTKNTAIGNVQFYLSEEAVAEFKTEFEPKFGMLVGDKDQDEEKKGEDKYETKLTGKSDTKIGEGLIDKFEESIGFDVKFLNDDSHIEEKIKK